MDFDLLFTRTEPKTGLKIPFTVKIPLPLVNWKGFVVVIFKDFTVYMPAEV